MSENLPYGMSAAVGILTPILASIDVQGDFQTLIQGGSTAILLAGIAVLAKQYREANATLIAKQTEMQKQMMDKQSEMSDKLINVIQQTTAAQTQASVILNSANNALLGLQNEVNDMRQSINLCHQNKQQCWDRLDIIKTSIEDKTTATKKSAAVVVNKQA